LNQLKKVRIHLGSQIKPRFGEVFCCAYRTARQNEAISLYCHMSL